MIETDRLGKVFRAPGGVRELLRGRLRGPEHRALKDVSLTVRRGEVLAVVGPNGAGKTTLLRILAGLVTPSEGQARIDGRDVVTDGTRSDFRRRVALIVGDERSFMYPLSGRENLRFFAALHGHSSPQGAARADRLLAEVGLDEAAHRRYATYSRGMRQRLALARGLLGDPEVLLLDEPTLGLDPVGARDLRRFLRDDVIRARGRTVIIGSNDPGEVRVLADRVLYLEAGRLTGQSTPAELGARLGLSEEVS